LRDLDISEVAQQSGVPASTLRFYEEKGLIAPIGRRGLRRLFDPGVLERLALIAPAMSRLLMPRAAADSILLSMMGIMNHRESVLHGGKHYYFHLERVRP